MALRDYTPPRTVIRDRGSPLMEVRGLNLDDISVLLARYTDDVRQMYELLKGSDQAQMVAVMASADFLPRVIVEVPSLAYSIIAAGADAGDEERAVIPKLSLAIQVESLTEIMRLTLEDLGGPNGVAALIRKMVRKQLPIRLAS
jgi:hypothetical protein